MKRLLLSVALLTIVMAMNAQQHKLWYSHPAQHWLEALPIGNSHLGAMVYGGTDTEEIQLNEETFWSGSPHNNNSTESLVALDEVRRLIFQGKELEASKLIDQHFIKGPHGMRFLPLGSLKLKLGHEDVTDYRRELNLGDAVATTSYIYKGVKYERTVFASQADSVIVVQLKADKKGALSFNLEFTSPLQKTNHEPMIGSISGSQNGLHDAQMFMTVDGVEHEGIQPGLKAACSVYVETDGQVDSNDKKTITVENATTATLHIAAATNFVNYHDVSGNAMKKVNERLFTAHGKSYKQLLKRHIAKYQEQYNRVSLTLPKTDASTLETDKRVEAFAENPTDLDMVALMMQYGARRTARQPAGRMERQGERALGLEIHHQHQRRDELLACARRQPCRDAAAAFLDD